MSSEAINERLLDDENPPLRRSSTRAVNRRNMEIMAQRQTNRRQVQKVTEGLYQQLGTFLYLFACNYIPKWFDGERSGLCAMPLQQANNYIAGMNAFLVALGVLFIMSYWAQRCYGRHPSVIAEWIPIATLVYVLSMLLVLLIFSTVWFIRVQWLWKDYSTECIHGWYQLDYANFLILLFLTGLATICTAFLSCILACLIPAICAGIGQQRAQQQDEAERTDGVLSALSKMVYDPETFKQTDQCAICLCEFEENQNVSPLPCNIKHYFHSECLEQWMKTKTECPLCRAVITENALKDFGEHVDELMHEKDDE